MNALRWIGAALLVLPGPGSTQAPPADGEKRVAWTTSRITGSPEPPPPYRTERIFPRLKFKRPLEITPAPGSRRLFVVEQAGAIYSFVNDPEVDGADLFIDLSRDLKGLDRIPDCAGIEAAYGLTFHPEFRKNRTCYITIVLRHKVKGRFHEHGTRVSRFTVSRTDPPRCDPRSEKILITWLAGGHNGGCLKFGPDGYLYIATGDGRGPYPPDGLDTGQDVGDLLGAILRIDVDRTQGDLAYAVPADNPFVGRKGVRPEIWAYGLRNPWKMSFDPATGFLWAGDVGWERWELLYRIERGGNYGWSIMEGPQPVRPNAERGPTPILPPAMALPHSDAASITGGYVYRGKRLPELSGKYVFADFELYRLFSAECEGTELSGRRELAQTEPRVVAIAEDDDGELYLLDYEGGGIHRIVRNDRARQNQDFPRTLRATGLFSSVADGKPAPGVYPYTLNANLWADHASAKRLVAIPGDGSVALKGGRPSFPKDSVLAKTLSLEMEAGNPGSRRNIETQILHYDGRDWKAYTYEWNEEQSDASLVVAGGRDRTFRIVDRQAPGGRREQRWRFQSRATCMGCHAVSWVRSMAGFNGPQLDLDGQVRKLRALRILPASGRSGKRPLSNPLGRSGSLEERARSYLHANCAHCHRRGGGGSAMIDLRHEAALGKTRTVDTAPALGSFGIPEARIVAPGDPGRSVLLYRMATSGRGRMPHVGSEIIDKEGLALVSRWIQQLPPAGARSGASRRKEKEAVKHVLAGGGSTADETIEGLLSSTSGALDLALALDAGEVPDPLRRKILLAGTRHLEEPVRDLFERFLPPDQRPRRLGATIDPAVILNERGDAERGRRLFFEAAGLQCAKCHRVGKVGDSLGPDLTRIGGKYTRAQLLESLLQPSKTIDPKFATHLVQTTDGDVLSGLLVKRTDREIVLVDAQRKEIRIPAAEVARIKVLTRSMMPEALLQSLTARQAADLIEFMKSLK